MQRTVEKIFFSLVRFELKGTELGDIKNLITPEVLPILFKLSKKHDLAHLIGDALEKNKLLPNDSKAKECFLKERNLAVYRYEQQQYELEQICNLFENAKIPFVPLKGSVIRSFYPEPWMRTSCDIDILINENNLSLATRLIREELGYEVSEEKGVHDISIFTLSGVHLELHFTLKENHDKFDRVLDRVWEYSFLDEGYSCKHLLSKEFFYLHIVQHAAYHLIVGGGCGIRVLLDLYVLKKVDCDEKLLLSLCNECGLTTFYLRMKELAVACVNVETLTDEQSDLLDYIFTSGMYGDVVNRVALKQVERKGKLKAWFSRVFLPYNELSSYYPILKKRKFLFPFYQVVRWFNLFFGKNSKNFRRELKAYTNSNDKDKQRAKRVLDFLNLE